MACAVVALIWANSPWSESYFGLWEGTKLSFGFGDRMISKPLVLWINDGLMAIFFFLVGLEIKREFLVGELANRRSAALPVAAALGGMIVPAIIFVLFNLGQPSIRGWGVPMATDIAFSLGVLALLGDRAPFGLKVFLAALAIVDDIGAVLVIALFYTASIDWMMLLYGFGFLALAALLNREGGRAPAPYLVLGLGLWICFFMSGVHPTVAGVLLAMTIPARVKLKPREFVSHGRSLLDTVDQAETGDTDQEVVLGHERQVAVHALERACEDVQMPIERMEHLLHPLVTFGIVPLFALANAGVSFAHAGGEGLLTPVTLGVLSGLLIGKPLGVFLFSWLAVRTGVGQLPGDVTMRQIVGAGVLAGIGFTMALFIGELAFKGSPMLEGAKMGILAASLLAGIAGYLLIRSCPGGSTESKAPAPQPEVAA